MIEQDIYNHSLSSPDKTALIQGETEVSYAQLWQHIMTAAQRYLERGLQPGDRVVLSASKDIRFVYAYFGAHLAGLITVPIDQETNLTRLNRIVDCAQPRLMVGKLVHHGDYTVEPFDEVCGDDAGTDKPLWPEEDTIADLMFTTGTTGLPKGVALSYANEAAAAENINSFIGNTADDVELMALPISHSFGLGRLRCVLSKGATLVMLGSFASMKKFYGELERCQVTGFGMVPASWAYIHKMSGDKIGQYAKQLRYIEIGSAYMPAEEKHRLMNLLPNTHICMHYGLTEASRSCFISFHDDEQHLDSVGKPSPNTDIKVFDEKGQEVADGTNGEICVKGKHVCSDYWGMPKEEFHNDFFGDYFRTGDFGHKTSDGYIYLVSRIKEIINVGGKKVSPIEVEEALNEYPGIEESACVGVHDDVLGEVVKAYYVADTDIDVAKVHKFLFGKIEAYKIPAQYERISEIPKTQNGKIQRLKLK